MGFIGRPPGIFFKISNFPFTKPPGCDMLKMQIGIILIFFLEEGSMEQTRRRSPRQEAILRVIRETDCHPSAEWVFQRLREEFPRVSLATVYRNIGQLRSQGRLTSVGVVDGQERLEGRLEPHPHFVCRRCGAVLDLPERPHEHSLDRSVQEALGGKVQGHQLTFYGLCPCCAASEKQE